MGQIALGHPGQIEVLRLLLNCGSQIRPGPSAGTSVEPEPSIGIHVPAQSIPASPVASSAKVLRQPFDRGGTVRHDPFENCPDMLAARHRASDVLLVNRFDIFGYVHNRR